MKNVGSKPFQIPARRDHLVEKFGGNERASGLPCPMLSTLVNEDLLVPDENGEVSLDALKSALGAVGVTPFIQGVLASGGAKATGTTEKQVVNLLKLQGS